MIDFDSLPPLSVDTPNAPAERKIARDIFEHAVILAINQGDKEAFQRSMTTLRPYYSQQR